MTAASTIEPRRRGRSLDGATCVVTGASRGIGSEIATELAREGVTVVVNFRSSEAAARETVETIEGFDGTAVSVRADVSAFGDVRRMAEAVRDEVGRIDVLVNNAGITADRTVKAMSRSAGSRRSRRSRASSASSRAPPPTSPARSST